MINRWKLAEIIKYSILVSALFYFVPPIISNLFENRSEAADIVLVDPKTEIHKSRSNEAFYQCNKWVSQEINTSGQVEFLGEDIDYKAWNLSSGKYLIQSQFLIRDEAGDSVLKEYACKVQFIGSDELDSGKWSFQGLNIRNS